MNLSQEDIRALYEVTVADADYSVSIEITPEGVVIERLDHENPAAGGVDL